MVLYGLTVIVVSSTRSNTAVSLLILTFLVPAVLFSAVAGVYVDRIDRRLILVATNVLRGVALIALYLAGTNFAVILLLNVFVSTVTVFFAPAEAAMIPALVGPQSAARGERHLHAHPQRRVRARVCPSRSTGGQPGQPRGGDPGGCRLYFLAAVFCFTLPASPPPRGAAHRGRLAVGEAERPLSRRSRSCARA